MLDYFHEDHDLLAGANVYNGQNSVLWCNFRDAFPDEIKATYQDLRSNGVLNYDELIDQFITKGSDKWSESIYNEDADFKYISMLYTDGDASNLGQVRGTGEEHLRYFIENRLNYCDGKWYTSAYADDYVALRIYTPSTWAGVEPNADITVTPYSHMYAGVRYKANGTLYQKRVSANEVTKFEAPNETFNDTETAIYGASQLSSLGDLSPLYCGSINVSKAEKLTELIIGSNAEGYSNPNLNDLSVGTNNLLKVLNVRNCSSLTDPLALSGCPNIEEIYAAGSGITGIELANSGYLKTIELPATITNLSLMNQLYIESMTLESYDAIKTIRIENCPTVDGLDILSKATNVERVRLTNVNWSYDTAAGVLELADRNLAGIDENGANIDYMWIDGTCHIKTLTGAEYLEVKEAFPYMTITYDTLTAQLTFMTETGRGEFVDTVPKIGIDESQGVSGGTINSNSYSFMTELIGFPRTLSSSSDVCAVMLYTPRLAEDVLKGTPYAHCYIDDDYVTYWSQQMPIVTGDTAETPQTIGFAGSYGTINKVRFNIMKSCADISYAYCRDTGEVLFAGKNTPYYGMKNINDNPVLCTQTIQNGGNGTDPVTAGTISKPTKESTAQYHFTYSGWSLTPGGVADPNALKNVEADRTVYVAFSKELRSYTVRFYNGTTLLQTSTVQYGGDAVYSGSTPINNSTGNPADFEFYGWKPAPTNIQGDTSCYAQFHDLREITDSWETIAANVANGTATEKYAIGAFKTLNIGEKELPYEFNQGSAVLYNNEIHILGSSASAYRTSHYKWTGTEWVEVSTLPYEFYYGSAVVYNNEIHILGGSGSSSGKKKHYKWNGSEWVSVSTLPYMFRNGVVVVYNNEIHIMGSEESSYYTSHYKWNGSSWSEVGELPYSFYTASGFIYNNEIHMLGSYDSKYNTAHYKYDGSSWISVSTLPQKLSNGHALVIGTDIYMIQWDEFYKYDGTNWDTCPNVPANVYEGGSVVLDGNIYVMGSSVSGNERVFYSYDTETSTWSKVGITESIPMQIVAHNHDELPDGVGKWEGIAKPTNIPQYGCAVTYQNEVHALGGNSSSSYTQHIKWDATNSTWVTVSTLPYQFRSGCALVLNDEIHILGSYQTTNKTEHYKWNATDGWVSVSTLPYSFYCSSAVVLNNEIHILGSYDSSCRKYHYKWNGTEWTSVSTLPYNFYYGSAVVYNDEIHIFSGSGSSTGHYKWDGSAWTSVSTLPYNLQYGVATIINNEIHIFGGSGNPTGHYKWNGTEWTSMTTLPGNFENYPLAVCNGTPYIFISTSCYKLAGAGFELVCQTKGDGGLHKAVLFGEYNNDLYFMANNATIWKFDGHEVTVFDKMTNHISDFVVDSTRAAIMGSVVYFHSATNDATKSWYNKLFSYDLATSEVSDLGTMPGNHFGGQFVIQNDNLIYLHGNKRYIFDGSSWTTTTVSLGPNYMGAWGNTIYAVRDNMLYRLDDSTYTVISTSPYTDKFEEFIAHEDGIYVYDKKDRLFNWDGEKFTIITQTSNIDGYGEFAFYKNRLYKIGGLAGTLMSSILALRNPRATLTFLAGDLLKDSRAIIEARSTNADGWSVTTLRTWCNSDFVESLPSDLQSGIKTVKKLSDRGMKNPVINTTHDKVWIPSVSEVGIIGHAISYLDGQGEPYSLFTNSASRIKTKADGTKSPWYLRSSYLSNNYTFGKINESGSYLMWNSVTDDPIGVLIGFCI